MKKILSSLLVITAVVAVVAVGSQAVLSDTEKNTGNAFTTGTIDIAVNGNNPWSSEAKFLMDDMKPSYTDYINLTIKNVGTNPANVWKTLSNFVYSDPIESKSEPECDAEKGKWDGTCSNFTEKKDIGSIINYDLRVELYPSDDAQEPVWWETIYLDSDNVKMDSLKDKKMYLGMIPAKWTMKVSQSYHMVDVENFDENVYQSDTMTFDIELYAEQLTNTITLENKENVQYLGYSHTILNDGKYAELTYKVMDDQFSYSLNVFGMPEGDYTLIQYADPLDGSDPWPAPNSLALANVSVSGGTGTTSGSIELNQSLINAKVWLVKATYTPGQATGPLTWSPTTTLFETGLIDYYDSL